MYIMINLFAISILTLLSGSVAERSKALVLGTSLFGGVGSNPTAAKTFCMLVTFCMREWSWYIQVNVMYNQWVASSL